MPRASTVIRTGGGSMSEPSSFVHLVVHRCGYPQSILTLLPSRMFIRPVTMTVSPSESPDSHRHGNRRASLHISLNGLPDFATNT